MITAHSITLKIWNDMIQVAETEISNKVWHQAVQRTYLPVDDALYFQVMNPIREKLREEK